MTLNKLRKKAKDAHRPHATKAGSTPSRSGDAPAHAPDAALENLIFPRTILRLESFGFSSETIAAIKRAGLGEDEAALLLLGAAVVTDRLEQELTATFKLYDRHPPNSPYHEGFTTALLIFWRDYIKLRDTELTIRIGQYCSGA